MLGFDGNLIEIATVLFGAVCVFIRPARRYFRGAKRRFVRRDCIIDFLNGATLIPFLLLIGSVFSTSIFNEVIHSKMSISLAGSLGIIFIIGELSTS
jgi:hypothetical protein